MEKLQLGQNMSLNIWYLSRYAAYLLVLVVIGSPLLGGGSVAAQETIQVRGWQHASFARMVFDWQNPVNFEQNSQSSMMFEMRFARPWQLDNPDFMANMNQYFADFSRPDSQTIRFNAIRPLTVNAFRNDNAIVLDFKFIQETDSLETVLLRFGTHADYDRLVFDWRQQVAYTPKLQGRDFEIRFNAPAQIDTSQLTPFASDGFEVKNQQLESGETLLKIAVPAGRSLRHFPTGNRIVVDFVAAQQVQDNAENAMVTPQFEADSAPPVSGDSSRNNASLPPQPAVPGAEISAPDGIQSSPQSTEVADEMVAQAPRASPVNQDSVALAPVILSPSPPQQSQTNSGDEVDETADLSPLPLAPTPLAPAISDATLDRPVAQADNEANTAINLADQSQDEARILISSEPGDPLFSFRFDWPLEVGAAMFRRGSYIWIVFDRRGPLDLESLLAMGQPFIEELNQIPDPSVTILRLKSSEDLYPSAQRNGYNWIVTFYPKPIGPRIEAPLDLNVEATTGPNLRFMTDRGGLIVTVPDPNIGDELLVATYKEPGVGVTEARLFPEFELLASNQGVVINRLGDDVDFTQEFFGFQVYSPEGLNISPITNEELTPNVNRDSKQLFDFINWARIGTDPYFAVVTDIMASLLETPPENRDLLRLDLARFYLARGFGYEALGVLKLMEMKGNGIERNAEFRSLMGVAQYLSNNIKEAENALNDPRLDSFTEAALWRGFILAQQGKWWLAASQFEISDGILDSYPPDLQVKLALVRLETAVITRDTRVADEMLKLLESALEILSRSQQADLAYHKATLASMQGDNNAAEKIWTGLVQSGDLKNAARAEFALVNALYESDGLTIDSAIDRLEKLRFQWRGDRFELEVLRRLASFYNLQNDYFNSLNIMRLAVRYFPNDPISEAIAQEMTDIFRDLFLENGADRLQPLRALAIYDEFRELTPLGFEGDRMIENLSSRLVDVDLLDRAADLLDHQVNFRLQGAEKARIGAKLALIKLLDKDPEAAIDAIRVTEFPRLENELDKDRRLILAKANFELGRASVALKMLVGDISNEADMLRRDIFWREKNWTELSRILQRLAGDPPADSMEVFPDKNARFVLNWAVALQLNNDVPGLRLLDDLYGPAMRNSSMAEVFSYVSDPNIARGTGNLENTIQQLSNGEQFNAFLNNYRNKYLAVDETANQSS